MGSEVVAQCECGLKATILIGGGMANFMNTCYFPCLCERCRMVVQVNLLAKRKQCPKCRMTKVTPYDEPRLVGRIGEDEIATWNMGEQLVRKLILTNGDYICPQCGKTTLHFADSGLCWD